MIQPTRRRRYPLVNKSHQYRFLALILIYNLIIVGVLAATLFVPDFMQLQDQTLSFEIRAAAADKILAMHSRVWPATITIICIIGLHSFRVFHRFVGPLYRFTTAFGQVRDGDLSFRVKLRKRDYLLQEETELNKMIGKLAEKMMRIQSASLEALNSLGELEQSAIKEGNDNEPLSVLHEHLDALMTEIRYFKLQNSDGEHAG